MKILNDVHPRGPTEQPRAGARAVAGGPGVASVLLDLDAKVETTGKVAARSEVMLRMPCQSLSHPPFELHTYICTMLLYFQNYICYNNTTFLQLNHSNFNFFLN